MKTITEYITRAYEKIRDFGKFVTPFQNKKLEPNQRSERNIDRTLADSFPASDPPSFNAPGR